MSAYNDQKKKRTTAMKLLAFPKTASQALVKGVIEQFKKSQRLPLLSRIMASHSQLSHEPPPEMDFADFHHL
jgi:hypothetical protein